MPYPFPFLVSSQLVRTLSTIEWTDGQHLIKPNDDDDYNDSGYRDDSDYMRDSWDAMTDGMYGDMPDGFDGDYDFLGR